MTKPERNKLAAGGGLMALAAVMLFFAFRPEPPRSAPAKTVPTQRQRAFEVLGEPQGATASRVRRARSASSLPSALDPALKEDLLTRLRAVKYEGTERNIFQFFTPAAPIPKPVAPVIKPEGPQPPPPPPPAPPIPLKFYGFASAPGETPRKAFLNDGEEIFIAVEGEVVKRRYRVLKISANSIEMEDLQTNSKQRLALVET